MWEESSNISKSNCVLSVEDLGDSPSFLILQSLTNTTLGEPLHLSLRYFPNSSFPLLLCLGPIPRITATESQRALCNEQFWNGVSAHSYGLLCLHGLATASQGSHAAAQQVPRVPGPGWASHITLSSDCFLCIFPSTPIPCLPFLTHMHSPCTRIQ